MRGVLLVTGTGADGRAAAQRYNSLMATTISSEVELK